MPTRLLHIMLLLSLTFGGLLSAWSQAAMLSLPDSAVQTQASPRASGHCHEMNKVVQEVKSNSLMHHCQDKPCQCDDPGCHASVSVPSESPLLSVIPNASLPRVSEISFTSVIPAPAKRPPIVRS